MLALKSASEVGRLRESLIKLFSCAGEKIEAKRHREKICSLNASRREEALRMRLCGDNACCPCSQRHVHNLPIALTRFILNTNSQPQIVMGFILLSWELHIWLTKKKEKDYLHVARATGGCCWFKGPKQGEQFLPSHKVHGITEIFNSVIFCIFNDKSGIVYTYSKLQSQTHSCLFLTYKHSMDFFFFLINVKLTS